MCALSSAVEFDMKYCCLQQSWEARALRELIKAVFRYVVIFICKLVSLVLFSVAKNHLARFIHLSTVTIISATWFWLAHLNAAATVAEVGGQRLATARNLLRRPAVRPVPAASIASLPPASKYEKLDQQPTGVIQQRMRQRTRRILENRRLRARTFANEASQ